ncbi:MAG: hypothetical protein H7Z15_18780 [Rhizobacter sp.]|nr:hypothetical protein [Rhizobacter sp.]
MVPNPAYFGVHTLPALEGFPITGIKISAYPDLINALAASKQAAELANQELGLLEPHLADAIVQTCIQIRQDRYHDQFLVDVLQGSAGPSTNKNALELLGFGKGDYNELHPNEHVNLSQSTNDVYPTALKIASHIGVLRLIDAMEVLRAAFHEK